MIFVASGTQDGRGLVEYLLKQNYKVMASVVTNYGKELLPKDENLIINYLKNQGKQHIDKMSFDLNLKSYELMPTLLDLELKQVITTLPGKFFDLI